MVHLVGQSSPVSAAMVLTGKPALTVTDLRVSYPDRPDVLCGVNLQISQHEKVGLIGPNGAGKTTLFLAICGVLSPQTGEIVLFESPVCPGAFRPEIGLVFQNPTDQLFSVSVWDDVAFGPINMGLSPEEIQQRVEKALTVTGVQGLADRPPHHLSGGEKRMVAIACVLAMNPHLVIYDEPSANLDIRSRRRLIKFLQAAQQTCLVSSHDLELILEVCDRVLLLHEGSIVADGPTAEIMGDEGLMEKYGLETPAVLRHFSG